ncbi:hypothetical protein KC342_g77 [Hortaea werneckii]|nr:hypothetical protein KC342_g77 [Hortaea werneckii]
MAPSTIRNSMKKKPSTRPQMSTSFAMKRLQVPPVIVATILTTAVRPLSEQQTGGARQIEQDRVCRNVSLFHMEHGCTYAMNIITNVFRSQVAVIASVRRTPSCFISPSASTSDGMSPSERFELCLPSLRDPLSGSSFGTATPTAPLAAGSCWIEDIVLNKPDKKSPPSACKICPSIKRDKLHGSYRRHKYENQRYALRFWRGGGEMSAKICSGRRKSSLLQCLSDGIRKHPAPSADHAHAENPMEAIAYIKRSILTSSEVTGSWSCYDILLIKDDEASC